MYQSLLARLMDQPNGPALARLMGQPNGPALARLMGQYWFARWRLSSSVTMTAERPATGHVGSRHFTAGQYGYIPLG